MCELLGMSSSRATTVNLSLMKLARRCRENEPALETSGVSIAGSDQQVVILASVPLSSDPWQALTEGEVMAVRGGQIHLRSPRLPGAMATGIQAGIP